MFSVFRVCCENVCVLRLALNLLMVCSCNYVDYIVVAAAVVLFVLVFISRCCCFGDLVLCRVRSESLVHLSGGCVCVCRPHLGVQGGVCSV